MRSLKIVQIAAEVHPFSKTGGLADVVGSLAKILNNLGHQVIIITPFYKEVIDYEKFNLKLIYDNLSLNIDKENTVSVSYYQGYLAENLPVYFVANEQFFGRKKNLYGSSHENLRFYLFDIAALNLLNLLNFQPEVIHCHDWHTGLIPELLEKNFNHNNFPNLNQARTVFTIHNLTFQLGHDWWTVPLEEKDYGRKALPKLNDPKIEFINFAKRGIIYADIINTVSEQYAQEILTKRFGQDLHLILLNKKNRLFGIINGINETEYNPATDPGLAQNYSADTVHLKKINKETLQKKFNLPIKDWPVIGMTSRIVEQKGFDLLVNILETLLSFDLQMIIMGDGDKKYLNFLNKIQKKYEKKFVYTPFDQNWETSVYAGTDMLLLPSRFEPCGINQLYALRYGCIPIVHTIGGLADTVNEFHYYKNNIKGNGFVFRRYHEYNLLIAVSRALTIYQYQEIWQKLVRKSMQMSSFWKLSAKKYLVLYNKAIKSTKK